MTKDFQDRVGKWVFSMFGYPILMDRKERATRILEEALELAQSEGVDFELAKHLTNYVYARTPGDPMQEATGVGLTLIAWAVATKSDLMKLMQDELSTMETPERRAVIQRKTVMKHQLGITSAKGRMV